MDNADLFCKFRMAERFLQDDADPGAPSPDFAAGSRLAMTLVNSVDPISVACIELEQLYTRLVGSTG
jgi:hypothetical protein